MHPSIDLYVLSRARQEDLIRVAEAVRGTSARRSAARSGRAMVWPRPARGARADRLRPVEKIERLRRERRRGVRVDGRIL